MGQPEGLGASFGHAILGAVYTEYARFADAETALKRTVAILEHCVKPKDYRIGEAIANLGTLYVAQGALEKAERLFEQAHECFQETASLNSLFSRHFLASYASLEHKTGHKKKAKELEKEAEMLAAAGPGATISRYIVDARAFR